MLMVSVLWVIVTCSREITVVDLYQVETFAEQIYLGYSLGNGNGPSALPTTIDTEINVGFSQTAIYVSLLAVAAVVMFIVLADTRRPNENDTIATAARSNWLAAVIGILLLLLLVAVPAANVFIRASFYVDAVDGQLTQNYSIDQVFRALKKSCLDYRWEMIWSLAISLASATATNRWLHHASSLDFRSYRKTASLRTDRCLRIGIAGPSYRQCLGSGVCDTDLVVVQLAGQLHGLCTSSRNHDFHVSPDRVGDLVCITSNTAKRHRSRIIGWFKLWGEFLAYSCRGKFKNDYWLLATGLRTMLW